MVFFPTCNKNCKNSWYFCPKVIIAKDHGIFMGKINHDFGRVFFCILSWALW